MKNQHEAVTGDRLQLIRRAASKTVGRDLGEPAADLGDEPEIDDSTSECPNCARIIAGSNPDVCCHPPREGEPE